jgi:hypothetical protein
MSCKVRVAARSGIAIDPPLGHARPPEQGHGEGWLDRREGAAC